MPAAATLLRRASRPASQPPLGDRQPGTPKVQGHRWPSRQAAAKPPRVDIGTNPGRQCPYQQTDESRLLNSLQVAIERVGEPYRGLNARGARRASGEEHKNAFINHGAFQSPLQPTIQALAVACLDAAQTRCSRCCKPSFA